MARLQADEILKVFATVFLVNILFAAFLHLWVTGDDIENLPTDPVDRWFTLFFFSLTTFTSIGFGEYGTVHVKSRRLKIVLTLYIVLAISGATSFFFNF
jgi:hypothetical protein